MTKSVLSTRGRRTLHASLGECVVYSVFGDESSDESKSRVFAVAGIFGSESEWADLESEWTSRTGGVVFHSADCENSQGSFKKNSHDENLALYKDLVGILCRSKVMGRGHAMDIAAWRANFPNVPVDVPYLTCFRNIVHRCGDLAAISIPQDRVEFTFDQRTEIEYNAGVLYDFMARLSEWESHVYLSEKVSFSNRRYVGIQVADLLARETMKHLDNIIGPKSRPTRKSMSAILNTGRFEFTFHMKEYFDSFKVKHPSLLSEVGIDVDEYAQWLSVKGLDDNISNRHRHIIEKFPPESSAYQLRGKLKI